MKLKLLLSLSLAVLIITFGLPDSRAQDFPDVCQQAENILPNCSFDNELASWQTFTEAGAASISVLQGGGECHAPLCPAAFIVTNDHFVGGLYQQVPVTAGTNYYANIVWLAFDSLANDASINSVVGGIGRRVGIDPFGGTDPQSPNVIWSADNWRNDCKICNVEHVTVTAQADTITVFVRIEDTWRLRAAEKGYGVPPSKDQFWLDDIGLKPVGGEAIVVSEATEPPPPPPTDTPLPPPPTDSPPVPAPTETPLPPSVEPALPATEEPPPADETTVAVVQTEPTSELQPTDTPQPTPTVAMPPTLTPTLPPLPTNTPTERVESTPVRRRRATPEASSAIPTELLGIAGSAMCIGGLFLLIMAAVFAGGVWLYRLGWGEVDEGEDSLDDELDDDDEIVVEIID